MLERIYSVYSTVFCMYLMVVITVKNIMQKRKSSHKILTLLVFGSSMTVLAFQGQGG